LFRPAAAADSLAFSNDFADDTFLFKFKEEYFEVKKTIKNHKDIVNAINKMT